MHLCITCVMACFQARGLGWAIGASRMNRVCGQVAREKLLTRRVSGSGSARSEAPFFSLPTWSALHPSECLPVESHPPPSLLLGTPSPGAGLTRPTSGRSGAEERVGDGETGAGSRFQLAATPHLGASVNLASTFPLVLLLPGTSGLSRFYGYGGVADHSRLRTHRALDSLQGRGPPPSALSRPQQPLGEHRVFASHSTSICGAAPTPVGGCRALLALGLSLWLWQGP